MGTYPFMGERFTADVIETIRDLRLALSSAEGLGLPVLLCLMEIATNEGLSVSELAERTAAPQQSVSRYVAILLGRYQSVPTAAPFNPLIEQRINSADPRKRSLYLTDSGAKLIGRILRSVAFGRK